MDCKRDGNQPILYYSKHEDISYMWHISDVLEKL